MTAILIASARPTTTMPASSADANNASRSKISVCPASIDSTAAPARAHRLNRRQPTTGHVEAHVLIRLGDLDDRDTRAGQAAGARDGLVGPFHRFDGHDRLVLDAIVWPISSAGDRVRHAVAERRDPSAVPRWAHARSSRPAPREQRLRAAPSNRAARRRVPASRRRRRAISASVLRERSRVSTDSIVEIGHDAAEDLRVLDLTGHDRLASRRPPSGSRGTCRAARAKPSASRPPAASAACASRSGKASSLMATTVTSWPSARAASRTRNGKRPLPAISPSFIRVSRPPLRHRSPCRA